MKYLLGFIISLILPTSLFAFFCPSNFNQINVGDTIAQVIQQCGKPDSQNDTKKTDENVPQQWDYYVPQTVATSGMAAAQGTLRTQITFDANGNAINISVNGIGVGSSSICGNTNISLGDNRDKVKAACGKPVFINKQSVAEGGEKPPATNITTMIFNGNTPVKLIFENGVLKEEQ